MKQTYMKQFIALIGVTFALGVNAQETPQAQWMSGKWGIGFRIDADNKDAIENYSVSTLVSQVQAIAGVEYVLFNLSDAAHGDAYLAPHSVLTGLTPDATPSERDLFRELAQGFQDAGIKVIAYAATQGPAMLKHGAEKAFDKVLESDGSYSSQAMINWSNYVESVYGDTTEDTYKQAYAEVIIAEYAQRYGALIDGWWFDHASCGNIPLLHDITTAANPNITLTFNDGQKIPLTNNNPDYEDYTFGHPTPIASKFANDSANLPMLESIEATPDGFFDDAGRKSLGHMFMPLQETWNSGAIVWPLDQAVEWKSRALAAGGAWTWNIQTADASSLLKVSSVEFIVDIEDEINGVNLLSDVELNWIEHEGATYPGLLYTRRIDSEINYFVEATTNLMSSWDVWNIGNAETNVTEWIAPQDNSDGTETVWMRANQSVEDGTNLFLRVGAEY